MEQRGEREVPELAEVELALFRAAIEQRFGLFVTETRVRSFCRSLGKRMAELGLRSPSEYYHFLLHNPKAEEEWRELADLLLNRETGFFRHLPSFQALSTAVIPELLTERAKHGISTLTAWSAGCSSGEEAYSLAMVLSAHPTPRPQEVKVVGSDLSPAALAKARRASYRASSCRGVPAALAARFLSKRESAGELFCEPTPELRRAVEFGRLNLQRREDYWVGAQDIIFCQNVLIYFRKERRPEIAALLAAKLRPKGYLFLAPGEILGLRLPGLAAVRFDEVLAYQRRP